jgi:hypothetical protein
MRTLCLQCRHADLVEYRGGNTSDPVCHIYSTDFCPEHRVVVAGRAAVASLRWETGSGLRGDSCETPVLGSHQYPAVFWSSRFPHHGLCVHKKYVGARPRRNADPGRRCSQFGWIRGPRGSSNGNLGRPLLCASPKGPSYTRALAIHGTHRSN